MGGFRGGGVMGGRSFFRNSTTCRPNGSPFCTILRYPFLLKEPKYFLKAPSVPIYSNFEEGERAGKAQFFRQNFPKDAPKNAFFGLFFFSKCCLRCRKFDIKTGSFLKIRITPPPPRENPRSAPDPICVKGKNLITKLNSGFMGGGGGGFWGLRKTMSRPKKTSTKFSNFYTLEKTRTSVNLCKKNEDSTQV